MKTEIFILSALIACLHQSEAAKYCYNCRGDECRTEGAGHIETCVRKDDICLKWIYREDVPSKGLKAGDVYKRGCYLVLFQIDGCMQDGKYVRCLCTTDNCDDNSYRTPSTTTKAPKTSSPIKTIRQPQSGRSFGGADFVNNLRQGTRKNTTTTTQATKASTTTTRITEVPATTTRITEAPATTTRITEAPATTTRITEAPQEAETEGIPVANSIFDLVRIHEHPIFEDLIKIKEALDKDPKFRKSTFSQQLNKLLLEHDTVVSLTRALELLLQQHQNESSDFLRQLEELLHRPRTYSSNPKALVQIYLQKLETQQPEFFEARSSGFPRKRVNLLSGLSPNFTKFIVYFSYTNSTNYLIFRNAI